ncbi:hypothetical protein V6Z12_A06G100300 [Gossypium hirsutum]
MTCQVSIVSTLSLSYTFPCNGSSFGSSNCLPIYMLSFLVSQVAFFAVFVSFRLGFIRCIISFCDNEIQESALSNWPRAKTRAAKVGYW